MRRKGGGRGGEGGGGRGKRGRKKKGKNLHAARKKKTHYIKKSNSRLSDDFSRAQ